MNYEQEYKGALVEIQILTDIINLLTNKRKSELSDAVKFGFIAQAERLGISGYMTNIYADMCAEKYVQETL